MKVLVATRKTQGRAADDFAWTDDGELVRIWDCPCVDRCAVFGGIETHRATTTAELVERPDLDPNTMAYILRRDLFNQGWAQPLDDATIDEWVQEDLAFMMAVAEVFEPGTVLERGGHGVVRVRRESPLAA